jgi:hypothetical protein
MFLMCLPFSFITIPRCKFICPLSMSLVIQHLTLILIIIRVYNMFYVFLIGLLLWRISI